MRREVTRPSRKGTPMTAFYVILQGCLRLTIRKGATLSTHPSPLTPLHPLAEGRMFAVPT